MMHGQRNYKLNQQTVYGIEVAFCIWPSGLVFRYCYCNNGLYLRREQTNEMHKLIFHYLIYYCSIYSDMFRLPNWSHPQGV